MNERARRPVLEAGDCAGAGEHRRVGDGLWRKEAVAEILLERRPESLAERALDEPDGAPAAGTERPVLTGGGAAGQAGRRIENVERHVAEAPGERPNPARQERNGKVSVQRNIRFHAGKLT